ncbi:MAG: tetratricopeptide repeat protein [Planctomycetota bacterium]
MNDPAGFDPTVPRAPGRPTSRRRPPLPPPDDRADEPTIAGSRPQPTRAAGNTRSTRRTPPAPPAAGNRQGRFVLGAELGRGGMGSVRLAEDPEIGRELAIKLLHADDPYAVERFREEAQITGQLQHPNIVPVYDLCTDEQGRPWLAMKRIEGESLADRISAWKRRLGGRRLPGEHFATVLAIFDKVCDAVAYAHSRGVIHRDIKPHNIMVGTYGEVLLVDWGLARPLGAAAAPATDDRRTSGRGERTSTRNETRPVFSSRRDTVSDHTVAGEIFGTPAYMPPEQAHGRTDEIDERSDIFALGAVLYHLLAFEPPYGGRSVADTLAKAAQHQLVPPRRRAPAHRIPRELQAIVLRAMANDPADRYATVRELQDDLAAWQAFRPTTAWRAGPIERAAKFTRRHPTLVLGTSLLVVAGLAVVVLLSRLEASESARRLSDEQLAAEALQRQLAESQAAAATHRADTAETIVEELGSRIRDLLDEQSRARIVEFHDRWSTARKAGLGNETFAETLTGQEVTGFRRAFDALFEVLRTLEATATPGQYMSRALIRQLTGDVDGAIDDYTSVLRIEPQHIEAFINRGVARSTRNEWEAAMRDFNAALAIDPRSAAALCARASAWRAQHDVAAALRDYDSALAIEPRNPEALVNRGATRAANGDTAGAIADFDEAIRVHPEHASAYANRGQTRHMQGDNDSAMRDFNAALAINPRLAVALRNRGVVRAETGDLPGAERDLDESLRIKPGNLDALYCRGTVRLGLRNLPGALEDLDAVLASKPAFAEALFVRGNVHRESNRPAQALEDYTAALRADPRHVRTLLARGNLYADAGRNDDAVRDIDAALAIDSRMWKAWYNRAAATQSSDPAATLNALQKAYGLCPDAQMRARIVTLIRQLGGEVPE